MTGPELTDRLRTLPAVLQHAIFLLATADERQCRVIEAMGQYGSIEIHWDQTEMKLFPRHKLIARRRETLTFTPD